MPDKSPKTWYVSYALRNVRPGQRSQRATETFSDEAKAKAFAKAKFEAGDSTVIAGTINPVLPKRMISSSEIADWLYNES